MTAPATLAFDLAGSTTAAQSKQRLLLACAATRVVVAVPAWFGMADRHQLVTYLDPDGARPVGLVSSPLAGVHGCLGRTGAAPGTTVLCLDVRHGWSAGLVRAEPDGLTEVAAWGIAPHEVAGGVEDAVACGWLVDHLFHALPAVADSIATVLVIDDHTAHADVIHEVVRSGGLASARFEVLVDNDDGDIVAEGAARICRNDRVPYSVGALADALTVRADGDPDRLAMHVVAAQHAPFPSTTRQIFELGDDDGSPLHFDVYEQVGSDLGHRAIDHRLVVGAHLVRERGFDRNMLVTFDLGANGLLSIGPVNAWRLDWQPGSVDVDSPA
jgi:hypothetical protein